MATSANNNPMFQQLKVMFPNLDNTILYSVWQSTNESVDAAIDVLLSFNDSTAARTSMLRTSQSVEVPREPSLETRLAERENAQYLLTPSGIVDPLNNKYFGDYIRQMQHKKKKKNRRGRKATATTATATATATSTSPATSPSMTISPLVAAAAVTAKKTRWIPLEEYTSDKIHDEWLQTQRKTQRSRNRRRRRAKSAAARPGEEEATAIKVENRFTPLALEPWEAEEPADLPVFGSEPTADELQPLLLEPVKLPAFIPQMTPVPEVESFTPISTPVDDCPLVSGDDLQSSVIERDLASYAWSMDDSYVWLTGSSEQQPFTVEQAEIDDDQEFEPEPEPEPFAEPEYELEPEPEVTLVKSLSLSSLLAEHAQLVESRIVPTPEPRCEQQWIVVKLYLDAGNIHRFSFARDQLSFERLQERVAHNLLQRADSPADCRAYAVTYEDDEGDRIAVCSQEELCEALRVHETCIWPVLPAGELPILRLHVRPVAVVGHASLNQGYILA